MYVANTKINKSTFLSNDYQINDVFYKTDHQRDNLCVIRFFNVIFFWLTAVCRIKYNK